MKNHSSTQNFLAKFKRLVYTMLLFLGLTGLYGQTTVTFTYTGGAQSWIVPGCVYSVNIEALGAQGGSGESYGGGYGGKATGTLAVVPGQVLNIYVGGAGANGDGAGGGFNGGGTAGCCTAPGSGGGASDIRVGGTSLIDRAIVAGGGGGGGGWVGGGGGGAGGYTGNNGDNGQAGGGGGGDQVAGGGGGFGNSGGSSGSGGALGIGGAGGGGSYGGGGGGGGYYGGGGGGGDNDACCLDGGGGGGGSSYTGGVSSGATMTGVNPGNGQIKITYLEAAPVLTCRDVTINFGTPPIVIQPFAPTPSMLAAQTKGVSGICPNPATPITMCNCPTGSVAVGYSADYGNGYGGGVISKFKLNCRAVNPDGTFGAATSVTCLNGTAAGGSSATVTAATNHAIVGFMNRMGCAIDQLQGRSKTLASILAGSSNASNTVMTAIGGAGGGPQPLQLAPDGYVIVGMQTYEDLGNGISAGYAWKYAKLSDVMQGIATYTADPCIGAVSGSLDNSSFDCSETGVNVVTLTATSESGGSSTCTFNVKVIPSKCGQPIQIYHIDTTATTAKVKWKAPNSMTPCPNSYELRIRKEISPGVWGSWSSWTTSTGALEHQFIGLVPSSFYNYQIRTNCGGGYLSISVNDWFYTLAGAPPFRKETTDVVDSKYNSENLLPENGSDPDNKPVNLSLVPNPASDVTSILIEGFENREKMVALFDLYGKLIFNVKAGINDNMLELDLAALNVHTGVYLVRVSDGQKQKTTQLMIER